MKNILIVDDEVEIRNILKEVIKEALPHSIDTAEDGEDALIKTRNKEYDLIISDINMPKLKGLELLFMLNEEGYKGLFYVMTGSLVENQDVKPDRLFTKPFSIRTIVESIKEDLE